MLELSILGFLFEEPLHGYELKERIKALSGHVRPVSSHGALYPAITRLVAAGQLDQHTEPGSGAAPRRILSLTEKGRADLLELVRATPSRPRSPTTSASTPAGVPAPPPGPAEQAAVPRRRQEFLLTPASFFYRDGEPVRAEEAGDLFRQGMLRVARVTGEAEREWLAEAIARLDTATG